MNKLAAELEALWHEKIPLAAAMQIRIDEATEARLIVSAGLSPNINPHGTAFAGSLYSLCALTAWGAVWLTLREHGVDDGGIVLRSATIDYLRPIREELRCVCARDPGLAGVLVEPYLAHGRSGGELDCEILAEGRRAVEFRGRYRVV
jgi:thioesterase domain-containing protein